MRIAMGVEYEGTDYDGFQAQPTGKTVAGCLNAAISQIANEPILCICAGRTDAGVHARGQVIHFDTTAVRSEYAWLMGVNSNLPDDIAIQWVKFVPDDFHARFEATARRYHYHIVNTPMRPGLYNRFVAWHRRPLDVAKMQEAANYLVGTHDFSAFRGSDCQAKNPVKTVHVCHIRREGNDIYLDIKANAFLYHMVRNIVGTLYIVGEGREQPEWILNLLEGKNRTLSGQTAPAKGLSLVEISYPEVYNLPILDTKD